MIITAENNLCCTEAFTFKTASMDHNYTSDPRYARGPQDPRDSQDPRTPQHPRHPRRMPSPPAHEFFPAPSNVSHHAINSYMATAVTGPAHHASTDAPTSGYPPLDPGSSGLYTTPSRTSRIYPHSPSSANYQSPFSGSSLLYPHTSNNSSTLYTPASSSNNSYPPSSSSSGYMGTHGSGYPPQPLAPFDTSYSTTMPYSAGVPHGYSIPPATRRDSAALVPEICKLIVQQQPEMALVTIKGKEKLRKPVDPPPLVEMIVEGGSPAQQQYLNCPHFVTATHLVKADSTEVVGATIGTLVSSPHRLKNLKNREGCWFAFPDVSCTKTGIFRLQFTAYEFNPDVGELVMLATTISDPFPVVAAKEWKGLSESTMMTRGFAEQGLRVRIRKEPNSGAGSKRKASGDDGPISNTPIRPASDYPPARRMRYDDVDPRPDSASSNMIHHPSTHPFSFNSNAPGMMGPPSDWQWPEDMGGWTSIPPMP
ncbi:hypothetical protein T440DRAFT_118101 [Plenodomus tracheiphilus IPT5]|uniref:Velvet domain-containing protein n=1 Tax=Plenodomus tracheiphilus IPT5 TaxID=1408161 RepID=A0A6A7B576_9PLEO|nr:hypothetical protein T440DRAFT_118101 [Plenodomus tracheiphilus IPT5]